MTRARAHADADARLVRRTARRVGLWITIAASTLVIAVLVAAFAFVFKQIPVSDLFDHEHHEEMIDVGGLDVLVGAVAIGGLAILLAGTLGLLATQRAVVPLVDALARQRRFVADASHELRTPLAILDTRLQALQRSLADDDPHRATVAELRDDSRRLIAIVGDLLTSLEVPEGAPRVPTPVDAVVASAVSSMRMLAADRDVDVVAMPVPVDAVVAVPEAALHRALVALLDNAVKHSPGGGEVTVTTRITHGEVRIAVADRGPGITGIAPERVFDRFARSSDAVEGGGTSRTGYGIGLSLVQDTMDRAGGAAEVSSTSADGTVITLRMPRAR